MAALNLTPRELEILVAYVKEVKAADIDWAKVAAASNCKTGKYARDKFASIRNKITGVSGTTAKQAATATKRKADALDDEEITPTPKPKAARRTKAKVPKMDAVEDVKVKTEDDPNEAGEMMDDLDA